MPETFMIYVDDSGNEDHGVLFSAVLLPADCWAQALGHWLDLRDELAAAPHELPTFFEIHSQPFLSARPLKPMRKATERRQAILAPEQADAALQNVALARAQVELSDLVLTSSLQSARAAGKTVQEIASAARIPQQDVADRLTAGFREPGILAHIPCLAESGNGRTRRRAIFDRCVTQLAALPGVRILTAATRESSGDAKAELYGRLLTAVDEWLADCGSWGTVVVDGTPSARTLYYRQAHRSLTRSSRRILEDEVVRDSAESHFIQMADIVAFCAHLLRQGQATRYLQLAEIAITPDGNRPTEIDPGFFGS